MYCPNCEKTVQEKDVFCENCGYKLSQKQEVKLNKLHVLLVVVNIFLFSILVMNKKNQNVNRSEESTGEVVEKEKSDSEKKVISLEQADEAIDEKAYEEAVVHLEEALAIEQDETTEKLKELAEEMVRINHLYIEDELGDAYDGLLAIVSRRTDEREYATIYQQAEDLAEQIKTSHYLKWIVILGRGGEWDFDNQKSLLDLEFGEENPEYFNDGHGRILNDYLTYLDNDFVIKNIYNEDRFADGIYLFYDRLQDTSVKIADLAEEVAEMGIRVKFYSPQRDQSVAELANKIDFQYFSEDVHYYAIIKGGKETDINSPYLTKETPESVIAYLEQVLEDGQY